jgi:hypothetical protein
MTRDGCTFMGCLTQTCRAAVLVLVLVTMLAQTLAGEPMVFRDNQNWMRNHYLQRSSRLI